MDKVKHWPSWANWYARDENGTCCFFAVEPKTTWRLWNTNGNSQYLKIDPTYDIVRIDPDTPWDKSLQRRPE